MSFKAGIDLLNLRSLRDGVGRFARQLLDGLASLDHKNEYFIFVNSEISWEIGIDRPNLHRVVATAPRRRFVPFNQVYFSFKSATLPPLDLLHSPVSLSPLLMRRSLKTVVTVHDLAFKFFPEACSRPGRIWWNAAWPLCLKKVRHIVADSLNTKADILRLYGIPEDKISVVYPYVSFGQGLSSEERIRSIRFRYHLPEKFILFVGAPHKRKNLPSLIKAFQILKEKYRAPHGLVLVGPYGWAIEGLLSEVRASRRSDDITLTGFAPDDDMASIYQAADAFVYPSLYEGFGYPPLEAMTLGVPVIMSGCSSLPEVGGDAAIYVNPLDPEDIARKTWDVLGNPGFAEGLRARGQERSKMFERARMIDGYLEIFEKIARLGLPAKN